MGGGEDGEGRDHQIGAKRCVRHAVSPRVLGMHTVIIMRNAALLARQTLAHIGQGPLRHEVKAQAQGNAASEVGRGEGVEQGEGEEVGCRFRRGQVKVSFTRRGVRCSFSSRCVSHHASHRQSVYVAYPHMHTTKGNTTADASYRAATDPPSQHVT